MRVVYIFRAVFFPVILVALAGMTVVPAHGSPNTKPFPVLYDDAEGFRWAIAQAQGITPLQTRINGITLPHHLLAADLIGSGLALLREQQYERIILLSPDHFRRGTTAVSVPERDFFTCFGAVPIDRAGVNVLLRTPQVSVSNLFSHEHGVQALLPFIAHYFPKVPVLPLALRTSSSRKDWDALAEALRPLLTEKTLVIQSTDFSHYLTWDNAVARDSETLRVLASGRPDLVERLHQPRHLDSRAAQYMQMKLQAEVYHALPTVIANSNSSQYLPAGDPALTETTSYIVQVYSADMLPSVVLPGVRATVRRYFLAGDFFSGRHLRRHLEDPEKRQRFVQKVRQLTGDSPLIVNLEGVISEECPPRSADLSGIEDSLPPQQWRLCMPGELTLDLLKKLKVIAAGLANNHSYDYGPEALAFTQKILLENGMKVLVRDGVTQFDDFAMAAFTDVDNSQASKRLILEESNLRCLQEASKGKPLFAFVHWGREGRPEPGLREKDLVDMLAARRISLVIGHHPHQVGKIDADMADTDTIVAWSLGNFLFDQPDPQAKGALLELTFFQQGTFWARQIPLGNLYTFLVHGNQDKQDNQDAFFPGTRKRHSR